MKKKDFTKDEVVQLYQYHFGPQPKKKNETLAKAFDEEEIFVLRSMDETSPLIVMEWIKENMYTASEDKLRSAFEAALRMKKFEDSRRAT